MSLHCAPCLHLRVRASRLVRGNETLIIVADQGILFHLNHPIRFAYVCGPIVGIRPIPDDSATVPYYVLLDIDDSSGQTVEVKIRTIKPPRQQPTDRAGRYNDLQKSGAEDDNQSESSDAEEAKAATKKSSALKPFTAATNVDNIKITNACAVKDCREKHLLLNDKIVELHTVIKAKGTITSYHGMRQIALERAFLVHTTDEEIRIWEEYTAFCMEVLTKPWHIDKKTMRQLERADRERVAKSANEARKMEELARDKESHLAKRREKHRAREAKEERKRQREKAELDGNPLDRRGWKPWPEVVRRMQMTKDS